MEINSLVELTLQQLYIQLSRFSTAQFTTVSARQAGERKQSGFERPHISAKEVPKIYV